MAGEATLIQHPPAIKVAGRRLSLSSRHTKPHNITVPARPKSAGHNSPIPDYPRPAPPGEEHTEVLHTHTGPEEEVPPKKERKHNTHDNEKKIRESPLWKVEMTRPTRNALSNGKTGGFGAAGRISQPAGRGLGA
ncbi:hypothetical protein AX15_001335 [Amanita polypyramis BW_CC]|nr:hypothetical protein AX15_001335 [Amanita polypyramis BW_CC]